MLIPRNDSFGETVCYHHVEIRTFNQTFGQPIPRLTHPEGRLVPSRRLEPDEMAELLQG